MKTAKALMAMVALAGVLGLAGPAAAVTFDVQVQVGWVNDSGSCTGGAGDACLGFTGTGGFTGTSLILNWDDRTTNVDSFLRVGALPDSPSGQPFPQGDATSTIDPGQTIRTAQIQHENNSIPNEDDFLAQITLQTLLTITAPDSTVIIGDGTGGNLDVVVNFTETNNAAPCTLGNPIGTICDDVFTFINIEADIPFTFDGIDYILQVRGLVDENGDPTCLDAGGDLVNCFTGEGGVNDRFVTITLIQLTQEVPLPGTLLLLGLGLVGMGAAPMLRKRG